MPVETLMTKLVVCHYHGRGQSIQVSHFSDSSQRCLAAIVGPVTRGVLVDALTFRAGAQFTSRVPHKKVIASRSNLDPSTPSSGACGAAMRACCSAVCLGQWRDGLGRGSEGLGTCHIIKTLSVAWDSPCSPFRRFESELSKTALTGYAARDLLPGFAHREGHERAFLRWLDQAGELDAAHPDSVRAAAKQGITLPPLPLLRGLCFFFMQAAFGVDPQFLILENNLTSKTHTSLAGLLPLDLSRTLQTRRDSSMFFSRRVEFSAWVTSCFRNDRLGALFVLRNLIYSSWQPQPANILDGVQHSIADVDPAIGVLPSELVLTLGEAGFLTPTAHGEPPADGQPRSENVLALLAFVSTKPREARLNGSVVRVDARAKEPS